METSVRPATSADVPLLLELARAAHQELSSERGAALLLATHPVPDSRSLELALGDGSVFAFLGALDDAVTGVALVALRRNSLGTVAELTLLYVEPEARELGLGEALLDAVVGWGRDQLVLGLDVPALPGTRAAKSFLEEMGFRARLLVMHKVLGKDEQT